LHGAQHLIPEYHTGRVMVDEYAGAGVEAIHGGEFAGLAWTARRLGIEGRVVYQAGYDDPAAPEGDATFYSGKPLGFAGVLASRRVKLWRDAVNDFELVALADRTNPKAAAALVNRVTTVGLSSDPQYRAKSKTIETF